MSTYSLFEIRGKPAPFATGGEISWKERLLAQIGPPSLDGKEMGISLGFTLETLAPAGHLLDVDNLCEPVFSILVNKMGWFGGRRPNIRWWQATKQVGERTGCTLRISTEALVDHPNATPMCDDLYEGPLPRSATDGPVSEWLLALCTRHGWNRIPEDCTLYLGFGDGKVNIGDIAAGKVKALIDNLWPLLGGERGRPEDHRVSHLIVEKGVAGLVHNQVAIKLWAH